MINASNSQPSARITILILGFLVMGETHGYAATILRQGLLQVRSADAALSGAFEVGDVFGYSFSYEGSVSDSDSDPGYGEFTGALRSLTIVPLTARTGIWTPAGSMGSGNVYTEQGVAFTWSFDVMAEPGFGPSIAGYSPEQFYMGFGGLPTNYDIGGGQTLADVTRAILDAVSPSNSNQVELGFTQGVNSQTVQFDLVTFHAPEPGRAMLLFSALGAMCLQRRRKTGWNDRAAGLGGSQSRPVVNSTRVTTATWTERGAKFFQRHCAWKWNDRAAGLGGGTDRPVVNTPYDALVPCAAAISDFRLGDRETQNTWVTTGRPDFGGSPLSAARSAFSKRV